MFENFVIPSLLPAVPEIFLLFMACLILLVDLAVKSPRRTLTFTLTQVTLALTALLTLWYANTLMPPAPGERAQVMLTFHNMFIADLLGEFLKVLACFTVMASLAYSRRYLLERASIPGGEYCVLTLFATLGMMVMMSANHFLSLYLGLEILSLSLCALTALQRDNAAASEAAMKYFVLGALASGMLLYGMSMLYGATGGSLEIIEIAEQLRTPHKDLAERAVLVFGLVFLMAGLAFKLGVVPFHMWLPDVYHGAPTSVTLLIAAAPKLAAFAMVIRLLVGGLFSLFADWQGMLMLLAVLSMGLGNVVAIAQRNIKRMLAWSAIAHMGFMLLGLASGVTPNGGRYAALEAYTASLFYMVTYVLTTLAVFGLIMLLSRRGFESDALEDFKGLGRRSPWFAAMMLILMLSLAGLPFFVGFVAKFAVLEPVVIAGQYWLAVLAVLFSLVGAFFYLRVIKIMYFDEADENAAPIEASFADRTLVSVNSVLVAAIGIFPQFLLYACGYVLARSQLFF